MYGLRGCARGALERTPATTSAARDTGLSFMLFLAGCVVAIGQALAVARRRITAMPISPRHNSAQVEGSGTGVANVTLSMPNCARFIVRLHVPLELHAKEKMSTYLNAVLANEAL